MSMNIKFKSMVELIRMNRDVCQNTIIKSKSTITSLEHLFIFRCRPINVMISHDKELPAVKSFSLFNVLFPEKHISQMENFINRSYNQVPSGNNGLIVFFDCVK